MIIFKLIFLFFFRHNDQFTIALICPGQIPLKVPGLPSPVALPWSHETLLPLPLYQKYA